MQDSVTGLHYPNAVCPYMRSCTCSTFFECLYDPDKLRYRIVWRHEGVYYIPMVQRRIGDQHIWIRDFDEPSYLCDMEGNGEILTIEKIRL